MMSKIEKRLRKQIKSLSEQTQSLSVVVFLIPCSEKELQTTLEERYHILTDSTSDDSVRKMAVETLVKEYKKVIGEDVASTPVIEFLKPDSGMIDGSTDDIKDIIPHGELLTDKLIHNCAKSGKTICDLMLIAYDQYVSFCRRECLKERVKEKKDKIGQLLFESGSAIEKDFSFLPWIVVKTYPYLIEELEKLDYVKSISLHENIETTPSLKVTNSNQTKMNITTSKSSGYNGTGVIVGIVESIIFTNTAKTEYVEGIDVGYRHLEDADITWESYSLPTSATKVGTSNHANQVSSIIVGQKRETWFVDYEGVAPGATVFGTSCADAVSLYEAIDYLVERNVSVINLSLEFSSSNAYATIDAAIDAVAALHNITFVIAAGNRRSENPSSKITSPAHAYNAITVGNLNTTGSTPYPINSSSNFNQNDCIWETNKPDICASGTDITFAKSAVTTESNSGTSFAAPYVTGVVAQMMEANSGLKTNYTKVKALLIVSANNSTSIVSVSGSNDLIDDSGVLRKKSGAGIVDAGIAVDLARRNSGTGSVYDLSQSQTIGQLFRISATSALTAEAGQTVRMVLCFNKPESDVLVSQYGNNIDLGMYVSDTPLYTTTSTKNNVEVLQFTTPTRKTFNLRAFLRTYLSSTTTTYLKIAVAYRIYD